ncbi:hypothetical protein ACWFQ8_14500 [Streptomyces sp. NPDC055254]
MLATRVGRAKKDDPAQVAEQAYAALMAGRGKIVAGSLKTKAQGVAHRVLPDRLKAGAHPRMAEPGPAGPPEAHGTDNRGASRDVP